MDQARIFEQTERLEQAVLGMFSGRGEPDPAAHQKALSEVRRLLMLLAPPPGARRTNPAFLVPGGITYGGQAGVGAVASSFAAAFGNPPKSAGGFTERDLSGKWEKRKGRRAKTRKIKNGSRSARCSCGQTARRCGTIEGVGVYRCPCGLELVDRKLSKRVKSRLKKALAKKR